MISQRLRKLFVRRKVIDMSKVLVLFLVFCVLRVMGGMTFKVENDYFTSSDDNYTHGTELGWYVEDDGDTDRLRLGYGIHQLIYTPRNIDMSEDQPGERPWCGMITGYRETWYKRGEEIIRNRLEVGVLGPAARSDQTQAWFHEIINDQEPMGWDNQMPNEPVLNLYHDRHHLLWTQDIIEGFSMGMEGIYGGTLGTTFINMRSGLGFKCGYNVPPYSFPGGIDPKGEGSKFFTYVMGELTGMLVFHNATIGDSFFRDREDKEREVERVVGEYRYGGVVGYGDCSLAFILCRRSEEFKDQPDGGMDWGIVAFEFVRNF